MAIKICISLQKGGSAKTTTAVNLSANLHELGYKVLLIDMDSQANASFASGLNTRDLDYSLYNVLTTNKDYTCSAKDAIIRTDYYDILPADMDVAELVPELTNVFMLKTAISSIEKDYDFIILDTLPQLNSLAYNAFSAADYIIIPAEPKPFHFTGMADLKEAINEVQQKYNPKLGILGILLVKHSNRTNLNNMVKDLIEEYSADLGTSLFTHTIREGIVVPESQMAQKPLIAYASKKSKPNLDYQGFTKEVINRIKEDR